VCVCVCVCVCVLLMHIYIYITHIHTHTHTQHARTHTLTHAHTHIGAQHIFQDLRVLYDVSFLDIPEEEEKQRTGTKVLALLVQKYLLTGTKGLQTIAVLYDVRVLLHVSAYVSACCYMCPHTCPHAAISSMTSAFFLRIPAPAGHSMRTRMRTHIAACGHVCGHM
jgi:hypothetical protein